MYSKYNGIVHEDSRTTIFTRTVAVATISFSSVLVQVLIQGGSYSSFLLIQKMSGPKARDTTQNHRLVVFIVLKRSGFGCVDSS